MNKRAISITVVLCLIFILSSCSEGVVTSPSSPEPTPVPATLYQETLVIRGQKVIFDVIEELSSDILICRNEQAQPFVPNGAVVFSIGKSTSQTSGIEKTSLSYYMGEDYISETHFPDGRVYVYIGPHSGDWSYLIAPDGTVTVYDKSKYQDSQAVND